MEEYKLCIEDLLGFIQQCPTAYQTTDVVGKSLGANGFIKLEEGARWSLETGGKYYFTRNGSAAAAFVIGSDPVEKGFNLMGAHTDAPALKLKMRSVLDRPGGKGYGTEPYGGPILSTWLDRDLSLAGSMMIKRDGTWQRELVDLKKPVTVIPNLAVHFDRNMKDSVTYNPQEHMAVLTGTGSSKADPLKEILAKHLECKPEELGEGDLYFYSPEKGSLLGFEEELFSTPRIDNLAGCHAILRAIEGVQNPKKSAVAVFYDNEETGSTTFQGADSTFLLDLLNRITSVLGGDREAEVMARVNSFMVSVDGAHGFHPNYAGKMEPNYAPVLNGGPVIKVNPNFRYATTAEGISRIDSIADELGIETQRFAMRADTPCGTTIGPISSSTSGIPALDVGIPMLAMHSLRETAGIKDQYLLTKILSRFIV